MKFYILALTSILTMAACGNGDSNKKSESATNSVSGEVEGKYKAVLRPLNSQANGFLPTGAAEVKIMGQEFEVKTYLDDDTRVVHIQDIHQGNRCPTLADDSNGDGFIDVQEAYRVVGGIIVALDGDLDSHMGGQNDYPRGGSFTYNRETKLDYVIEDFHQTSNGAAFEVEGKVVLTLGTSDLSRIPLTVETKNNLPRNLTLPIACGILKRK